MIVNVLGVKRGVSGSFTDKKTGNNINYSGCYIYVSYDESGVDGIKCESFFLNSKLFDCKDILPNSKLDLSFNRYGKPISYTVIK